jgi:CRP/FNR family transcriptional regulator, anaerobic regulatory protein
MGATATVHALIPRPVAFARPVTMLREVSQTTSRCAVCRLREQCLPSGLNHEELRELREAAPALRRVRRGEALYRAGDSFRSLYAVRLGFLKSYVVAEDGRSQITGFQLAGDLLGIDGIDTGMQMQNVVALEDSDVCIFQYARLESAASRMPALRRQLDRLMSREIVREHGVMMQLGTMRAEERVAAFLLNLSERYQARGYAGGEFNLRMTREEIASYVGIKFETVSRILSGFQKHAVIATRNRHVRILDKLGLSALAGRAAVA